MRIPSLLLLALLAGCTTPAAEITISPAATASLPSASASASPTPTVRPSMAPFAVSGSGAESSAVFVMVAGTYDVSIDFFGPPCPYMADLTTSSGLAVRASFAQGPSEAATTSVDVLAGGYRIRVITDAASTCSWVFHFALQGQ
jgi:hypothetical protein